MAHLIKQQADVNSKFRDSFGGSIGFEYKRSFMDK